MDLEECKYVPERLNLENIVEDLLQNQGIEPIAPRRSASCDSKILDMPFQVVIRVKQSPYKLLSLLELRIFFTQLN